MKWHPASSARQFRLVDQTLTLNQVAEFWRTRRVKEEAGGFASISAAFGPAGPIHLGNPGLKSWLDKTLPQLPSGSSTAQAIRYGFNQWEGLLHFLDDGRIEIDSNTVERSMRPVALNRKNALFAGSDEGAENWAMLASLIETCKLHGINPHAYLADVLTKLVNNWHNRRLGELLPWAWTPETS